METFVIVASILLSIHGLFTLIWMLYAWEDPLYAKRHTSPDTFEEPFHTFTLLIPARHEQKVIGQTIKAISQINYPRSRMEALIIIRVDDPQTISAAQKMIDKIGNPLIRIIYTNDEPINKPHSLNVGLTHARGDMVAVFDAEDEPHREILNVVNTIVIREKVDVVQGGVQLMNYNSKWFSLSNVLEYFFWFKSGLHFFTKIFGVTPLGGNTVFFKRGDLLKIGGWKDTCLTEDAEIGIRLSQIGTKVRVVYDESQVTQEETPLSTAAFIKQRTRWNQGFLQILIEGEWAKLHTWRQKIFMAYILLSPFIQSFLLLYTIIGLWIAFNFKISTLATLLSFVPFYILLLQLGTQMIGIYEFSSYYKKRFPIFEPFNLLVSFLPYNFMLFYSAVRAVVRLLLSQNAWEKTEHINAHRKLTSNNYAIDY